MLLDAIICEQIWIVHKHVTLFNSTSFYRVSVQPFSVSFFMVQDATLLPKWKAFQTIIFLERVRLVLFFFSIIFIETYRYFVDHQELNLGFNTVVYVQYYCASQSFCLFWLAYLLITQQLMCNRCLMFLICLGFFFTMLPTHLIKTAGAFWSFCIMQNPFWSIWKIGIQYLIIDPSKDLAVVQDISFLPQNFVEFILI